MEARAVSFSPSVRGFSRCFFCVGAGAGACAGTCAGPCGTDSSSVAGAAGTAGAGAAGAGAADTARAGAAAFNFANIALVLLLGICETASSCGVGKSFSSAGASFIFTLFDLKVKPLDDIYYLLSFSKAIRLAACSASGLFRAVASAITAPCMSKTPIVKTLSCGGPSTFTSLYRGGW